MESHVSQHMLQGGSHDSLLGRCHQRPARHRPHAPCHGGAISAATPGRALSVAAARDHPEPSAESEGGCAIERRAACRAKPFSHFGCGAFAGALYPATRQRVAHPLVYGSGYGVAIWAASYFGWIPALHALPPPHRHPANRRRLMIVVHLVGGPAPYGSENVWRTDGTPPLGNG